MVSRNGGDRGERFQSLYRKYYRRIVRYFMRAFRVPEADAEELTQDTFLRFFEAMDEYRGDAEWGFLETTAMRVGLNRIRASNTLRRRGTTVDIDDPAVREQPVAPAEPDYAERQEEADRKRRLHRAIDELPPGQQQCVKARLEGLSYEQIVLALRISLDAVRSRLRDATRTLRAKLGADSALPEDEQ
jgi:RNA polymerase sigma-70 factor, ECF subfamily